MLRNGLRRAVRAGASPAALLVVSCCLLPTPAAAARAVPVEAGKARLAIPAQGRGALLVPIRYPIQLLGQRLRLRVSLSWRRGRGSHAWEDRTRANGGPLRLPERRRRFTFVHRIDLSPRLTRQLRSGRDGSAVVRVEARGALDVNRDGMREVDSRDVAAAPLSRRRANTPIPCADVPLVRTRPGRRITVRLPLCGWGLRWKLDNGDTHGTARIRNGRLSYKPDKGFRGTESIGLVGHTRGASASADWSTTEAPIQIVVGSGGGTSVRAMGDSVTAGFGYYDNGSLMPFTSLLSCRPGAKNYNDACSSNSTSRSNEGSKVEYAADYGLSNNVSWAAQWANAHGVSNYANFAVSGSESKDWAPGGQFYSTTERVEEEDPDYILMTVGANPLLSNMLLGLESMECALWSDLFGKFEECVEKAFQEARLQANLRALYKDLVNRTGATIYLMQYPLTVPSSALAYSAAQIAMTGQLLNRQIASAAAAVNPKRLLPIAPPHFNVGIDISPLYPSEYTCSYFEYKVDGPSAQSEPTQDELLIDHPLSFCKGPSWVIGGDTGIHPSAAGYSQMAAQVPAPTSTAP